MVLVTADRVLETTETTGTGTVDLGGAITNYQGLVVGVGDGNTCYYCIQLLSGGEWEIGIGTVTDAAPDTLSRDTVLQSSNADALVNFSAGVKQVFVVEPAEKRVHEDADGNVTLTGRLDTEAGRICNTTRIDDGDSPYTILAADHIVFCDTDGGVILAELPAGVEGTHYRLTNVGSSGNNLTVDPDGVEQLFGGGAGVAAVLADGETINIYYNAIEGWW